MKKYVSSKNMRENHSMIKVGENVNIKKSTLYLLIIFSNLLTLALLIGTKKSWWELAVIIPLTWSFYYLFAFIFSVKYIKSQKSNNGVQYNEEKIALLMTVCDDFNVAAANTLTRQKYQKYHIFILDDSRNEQNKKKVISWCREHSNKCTRLFRENSKGFKAGNLNSAEKKIPSEYNLFCIVDSDQHLDPFFLENIYNKYCENERPTFVQGIHYGKEKDVTGFSRCLAPTIFAEWKYHVPYKNIYGQTGIGGHGYLIERSSLNFIGGHPEIVSEDLALTMNLSAEKYDGLMTADIVSMEIYPESFSAILRRRFKWVSADWEIILTKYFVNFLKNSATFIEKLDLFLRETRLPMSTIYFGLIELVVLLEIITKLFATTGNYSVLISPAFALSILALSFSPLYPLIDTSRHSALNNIRAFWGAIFLGSSFPSLQCAAGIYYHKERKATFWVTNSASLVRKGKRQDPRLCFTLIFDMLFFFSFLVYSILFSDLIILAFGLALIIRFNFVFLNIKRCEDQIWIFGLLFIGMTIFQIFTNNGIMVLDLLLIASFPFTLV